MSYFDRLSAVEELAHNMLMRGVPLHKAQATIRILVDTSSESFNAELDSAVAKAYGVKS